MKLPGLPRRVPGRRPTPGDRDELVRIWDALSDDGRKALLFFAVAAAKEEGLPEGDGPLIRTGKR
jgi:hypothetical protein